MIDLNTAELLNVFIQILIGLFALGTAVGAAYLTFRTRINAWWEPYDQGLKGMAEVPALKETVKKIEYLVGPNGGGSLTDAVNRTETKVTALTVEVALLSAANRVALDANDAVGTFEADALMQNRTVNATYARWLGCERAELMGFRFLAFVHHDDREMVRDELTLARQEKRPYRIVHRVLPKHGDLFYVEISATPIPEGQEPARWIGTVRRVDAPTP